MTRDILGKQPAPALQPAPDTVDVVQPASPDAQAARPDALAGALPAWDLLPAMPFVRRVK